MNDLTDISVKTNARKRRGWLLIAMFVVGATAPFMTSWLGEGIRAMTDWLLH